MKGLLILLLSWLGSSVAIAEDTPLLDRDVSPTQQSVLSLCNRSGKSEIYAAYAVNEGSWTTRGWYGLKDGECRQLLLGGYRGNIFIYAEFNGGELIWGDGPQSFCVIATKAFVLKNADTQCSESVELKKIPFGQEFPIAPGVNTYNFKL